MQRVGTGHERQAEGCAGKRDQLARYILAELPLSLRCRKPLPHICGVMGAATALPVSRGATAPVVIIMLLLVILGQLLVVRLLTSSAWAIEGVSTGGPDATQPTPGRTSTTRNLVLCATKDRTNKSETSGWAAHMARNGMRRPPSHAASAAGVNAPVAVGGMIAAGDGSSGWGKSPEAGGSTGAGGKT